MEIINKAVTMINEHDFFWFYADYEASARESSRGHMAAFVELVNSILDVDTRKALKDLWMARYEWAKKNMFEINGKSSVSCPLKPSDSAPLKHSTMPP